MGDISRHFSKSEFECKCGCGTDFEVSPKLLYILEELRFKVATPIKVTSGFRCLEYNRSPAVGSNDNSQHPKATAADIQVKGRTPTEIADLAEEILDGEGGLGRYKTFTHIDARTGKARWGKN